MKKEFAKLSRIMYNAGDRIYLDPSVWYVFRIEGNKAIPVGCNARIPKPNIVDIEELKTYNGYYLTYHDKEEIFLDLI